MFKFSANQVPLTANRIQGGAYIHIICFYPHPYIKKAIYNHINTAHNYKKKCKYTVAFQTVCL